MKERRRGTDEKITAVERDGGGADVVGGLEWVLVAGGGGGGGGGVGGRDREGQWGARWWCGCLWSSSEVGPRWKEPRSL